MNDDQDALGISVQWWWAGHGIAASIAERAKARALEATDEEVIQDESTIAVVFGAFILEGIINEIGESTLPASWTAHFEKGVGLLEKLALLEEVLELELDHSGRSYQSIIEMIAFRNSFAHPRLWRSRDPEAKPVAGKYTAQLTQNLLPKAIRNARPEFAVRGLEAVEDLTKQLDTALFTKKGIRRGTLPPQEVE